MMNKRLIGKNREQQARAYLISQGYEIVETNYKIRIGEIDIIAKDKDVMCFIEVKYRKNNDYGMGAEAVDKKKQKIIISVAKYYIAKNNLSYKDQYRFDVVSIDDENITLYKGAFA